MAVLPRVRRQLFRDWAAKNLLRLRPDEAGEVKLTRKRVYILPTRAGLILFVLLIVMFLCSINYSLSLGFALTFLIAACAIVDMVLTYRNLAHVSLRTGQLQPVFAGEQAMFDLHVHNRSLHDRYAVRIGFDHLHDDLAQIIDLSSNTSCSLTLGLQTQQRGWLAVPRVRLSTRFPLGLLRAWAYWQPAAKLLVYPTPEDGEPLLPVNEGGQAVGQGRSGHDDFAGVRPWQAGDSIRHLAWRQIARSANDTLVTKQFEGGTIGELVFDYDKLPPELDVEQKLARMTRWVLMAEAQGLSYGFALGNMRLPAASGPVHMTSCLQALALHGATA